MTNALIAQSVPDQFPLTAIERILLSMDPLKFVANTDQLPSQRSDRFGHGKPD